MKNSIDLKQCLLAYDVVCQKGKSVDGRHEYLGVTAWTDFDGYHCFLKYKDVEMTLMFHGKYDIQFTSADNLRQFEKKLIELTT